MYEVELKLPVDHDRVRDRLTDVGANPVGTVLQTDTYYNAPHRSFADTDEALRLREHEPVEGQSNTLLTYKGPLIDADSKTREEFETGIEDRKTMEDILERLGFTPAATVTKRRERYQLDSALVTLDTVEGLGEFLEIEAEQDNDNIEAAREAVKAQLRALELDPDEQIRTSYLGLLLTQQDSNGTPP